jgi:hypothetical protein
MFHGSHLPLNKWFQAIGLLASQREDMSAVELSREIKVSYESAWSIARRIRLAMAGEHAEFCRKIAVAHNGAHGHHRLPDAGEPEVES